MPPNLVIDSWTIFITYDKQVLSITDNDCELGTAISCALTASGQGNLVISGLGYSVSNVSSTLATMTFSAVGSLGTSTSLAIDQETELGVVSGDSFVQVKWVQQLATVTVSNTPAVTSFTPSSAWGGGGTVVTIQGDNFQLGATVKIGNRYASDVTVVDAHKILAKTPPVEVFGDVTGDGIVRLLDAICVLRRASRLTALTNCRDDTIVSAVPLTVTNPGGVSVTGPVNFTFDLADATGDGLVRLVDAICVLRRASRLVAISNCPNPSVYAP